MCKQGCSPKKGCNGIASHGRLKIEKGAFSPALLLLMLFAVFLFSGCVKKVVMPLEPAPVILPEEDSEAALIQKAEAFFESRSYPESLAALESFLNRFPLSSRADAALMRIGAIQKIQGDFGAARMTYERLVKSYPGSIYIPEARMEILEADYRAAAYERAIQGAAVLLQLKISNPMRVRALTLMGDAYLALSRFPEAIGYYLKAIHIPDESDREKILSRMEEAIGQMDNAAIRTLMLRTDDPVLKSRLVLALAKNSADSEKPEEAVDALKDFLEQYPDYDTAGEAKILLEELATKTPFDRQAVGCLLPLSGPYQAYGKKVLRGIEMAMADFIDDPDHPRIRLIVKDTRSDPVSTVGAVRELHQAGVTAIIGPIAEAESAAAEAQKLKIPIITLTQKENIAKAGDYVFRNFMTPRMQVEALVGYCVRKLGLSRFAVLYPEESYGKTFMNLFWDAVVAQGGAVVGVESYPVDQTDFADPIKKMVGLYYDVPEEIARLAAFGREKEIGPESDIHEMVAGGGMAHAASDVRIRKKGDPHIDFEALFIPDAPDKVGLILPQLVFYDVREIYLLGTNLWHSRRLIDMAQKYAQGAMMPDGFDVESPSIPTKVFVERFTSLYGEKPGFMEAVAYDTARVVFQEATQTDVRSRSRLREKLIQLDGFQGLTGSTAFGPEGDARKTLFLFRIKGDRFVEVR